MEILSKPTIELHDSIPVATGEKANGLPSTIQLKQLMQSVRNLIFLKHLTTLPKNLILTQTCWKIITFFLLRVDRDAVA